MAEKVGAPKRIRTSGLCLRRAMFPAKIGINPCFLAIHSLKHAKNKGIILPSFTAKLPRDLSAIGAGHDRQYIISGRWL